MKPHTLDSLTREFRVWLPDPRSPGGKSLSADGRIRADQVAGFVKDGYKVESRLVSPWEVES